MRTDSDKVKAAAYLHRCERPNVDDRGREPSRCAMDNAARGFTARLTKDATMPRVKQASKQKRTTKTAVLMALGATGLGLSLVGSASASTMPTADIPQSDNTSPNQRFVLSKEKMADVSLATFHLFDRENFGSGVQLARGCGGCGCGHGGGCGGCRGCGGFRGCGGGGVVGLRGGGGCPWFGGFRGWG